MVSRLVAVAASLLVLLSPTAVAAQAAGTLISADPVVETPGGMQAWKVRYWTTDGDGKARQASGMVVAPREAVPRTPRSVVAWQHGTWGVAEKCAPSLSPAFFSATPALADMIARGYAVVATDYIGLGSPGPHGYLVGEDAARAVLDGVRAARAIPGAATGTRFATWGESQGGHAALWAGARARDYASELTLVGIAAAAPPTDLPANLASGTDPNVRAMLTAFTAHSWSRRFGAPLRTLVKKPVEGVIDRLAQNNCIELGKTPKLGTILGVSAVRRALRNKDMGRIEPWAGIARANSVNPLLVWGPVLIAQSVDDPVVAPAVTRNFARALCRRRSAVRWVDLPGGDHGHSARDSATLTLDWIGARFRGEAPPLDCGKI